MDIGNYLAAAASGDHMLFRDLTPSNSSVLLQATTYNGDTILHFAIKFKREVIAETIISLQPSLLLRSNSKGDTPLHIAATLGSSRIVKSILSSESSVEVEADEKLVRMVNMEKDTAFHEAARRGHLEVVKLLIERDQELAMLTNNAGESPLFLAVDNMRLEVAEFMLKAAPDCSFQGRNKMNTLHAAVIGSSNICDYYSGQFPFFGHLLSNLLLTNFWEVMKFRRSLKLTVKRIKIDFIKELIQKCPTAILEADELGWTPLHCAALLGDLHIIEELLLSMMRNERQMAAPHHGAYIKDKNGMTALHIAAKEGKSTFVLHKLVKYCPDIWELQDNQGQTALHLAVVSGNMETVKFILERAPEIVINQQDNEGNTPLHLAANQEHHKIFELLINGGRVDKTAINKKGLAVIDIIQSKEFNFFNKGWMTLTYSNNGCLASLKGVLNSKIKRRQTMETKEPEQPQQTDGKEPDIDRTTNEQPEEKRVKTRGREHLSYEQLRNAANINLVVTTIISTVSFAAGITMPGGNKADGPHKGTPILSKSSAFKAFVISNTFTFCCSTTSMVLHFLTALVEKSDVLAFTSLTVALTSFSILGITIAFISASYAVLADSVVLAIAVLSIGSIFCAVQFLMFLT